MPTDCNPIRKDFPALGRDVGGHPIAYFDNAATTLKPSSVIGAITEFYSTNGANIHRGKHILSEEASDAYEAARVTTANYLGAYAHEVVFVRNTTEALNLVATGLELSAADSVVGCLDAHHSQILPWRRAATLHFTRIDHEGRVDLDHFRELLKLNPKVVALTHCSNVTGVVHPVAAMAREAKQTCGAIVVLDAAQSIPHHKLDVTELGADFVAFSAHKMLGPSGVGCLYGRSEALETFRPLVVGGGTVDWVDTESHVERRIPHRFEAGTPAIASVIGLGAAIRYLEALDQTWREAHNLDLTRALIEGARGRPYLKLVGPDSVTDRHSIATIRLPRCKSVGELARLLSDSYGVMCRSGHLCAQPLVHALAGGEVLRASAFPYNSVSEIEHLYAALDELAKWMRL